MPRREHATARRWAAAFVATVVFTHATAVGAGPPAPATAPPTVPDAHATLETRMRALRGAVLELAGARQVESEVAGRLDALGGRQAELVSDTAALRRRLTDQLTAAYVIGGPSTLAAAEISGDGSATDLLLRLGMVASISDGITGNLEQLDNARRQLDGEQQRLATELESASRRRMDAEAALSAAQLKVVAARDELDAAIARQTQANAAAGGGTVAGIPQRALGAYLRASERLAREQPGCRLPWSLLAAIGAVESGHGSGGGGGIGPDLRVSPPVFGPVLDGGAFRAIRDTDDGRLDGDPIWDRAVGPMQFIPSTWRMYTDSEIRDPHNYEHATVAAGRYLCRAARGAPLDAPPTRRAALLAYNRSERYVAKVEAQAAVYAGALPALPPPEPVPPSPVPVPPSPVPVGTAENG